MSSSHLPSDHEQTPEESGKWSLALRHLIEALKLLDESNAPAEIGARLDHAIHDLQDLIGRESRQLD